MSLNFIYKSPTIKNWLVKQIGYYSKQFYVFDGDQLTSSLEVNTKVIIIAKCHYSETWQSFSSINKKELQKILALKKGTGPKTGVLFQSHINNAIDGFDVKTIKIDPLVIEVLGENRLYIPETELFTPYEENQLLEIETLEGKMFCSQIDKKVKTSYAKGIFNNIETYKLSVGLSENIEVVNIAANNCPLFLLTQLFKLNYSQLAKVVTFNIKTWFNSNHLHMLYWAPLLTALCFYIALNSYIYIKTNNVEQNISSSGKEISDIITDKRALDNNLVVLSTLTKEFKSKPFVHNHWEIIDELLSAQMTITRINFKNGELVIRGVADKASDVLSMISVNKQISSAAFEGPVRKSRGKDSFILTLQVKEI